MMKIISKLLTPGWCVAWRRKNNGGEIFSKKEPFIVIPNPKDAWVADPFVFENENELYIFGELYELEKGKGSIAYCKPLQKECKWIKIIEESYHMSYPFIFKKDSNIYIMPETEKNKTIQLYKSISFPNTWEKQSPLRENADYVDVTPFLKDSLKKALAYRVDTHNIKDSELWLIDFNNPKKDYKLQVSNLEIRRPGGAIDEVRRVRVGQDSTYDYGDGLVFFQYEFSNMSDYHEREIKRVYANQLKFTSALKCDGIHTYNQSEHFECIDVRIKSFNIKNLFRKILSRLI